jgi:hypothetical protein
LKLGRGRWQDFNPEAAAQFIEDVWKKGRLLAGPAGNGIFYQDDPIGNNVSFDPAGTDFTPFARASIAYMRSFKTTRPSRRL